MKSGEFRSALLVTERLSVCPLLCSEASLYDTICDQTHMLKTINQFQKSDRPWSHLGIATTTDAHEFHLKWEPGSPPVLICFPIVSLLQQLVDALIPWHLADNFLSFCTELL